MIKKGDKLIAKNSLLLQYNIPYEKREMEVIDWQGDYGAIKWGENQEDALYGHIDIEKYFFLPNSINCEILRLIENERIQFKSFNGVTMDNKVIQINLP